MYGARRSAGRRQTTASVRPPGGARVGGGAGARRRRLSARPAAAAGRGARVCVCVSGDSLTAGVARTPTVAVAATAATER